MLFNNRIFKINILVLTFFILIGVIFFFSGCAGSENDGGNGSINEHPIYVGQLSEDYDIGVNSSEGFTEWLTDQNDSMRKENPAYQDWGAVFITVKPPVDSVDLSSYNMLSVDIRGEMGREVVAIGIKDDMDPDDGTETLIEISDITTDWKTYTFPLSDFTTADLTRVYVVIEFVFTGRNGRTVLFNDIKYLE
jgi:hypothetical protein